MTDLQTIREMLARYEEVTAKIQAAHPDATEDQVATMAATAMNQSLGL